MSNECMNTMRARRALISHYYSILGADFCITKQGPGIQFFWIHTLFYVRTSRKKKTSEEHLAHLWIYRFAFLLFPSCQHANVEILKFHNLQICRFANSPNCFFKFVIMSIYKFSNLQNCRIANWQNYTSTQLQTARSHCNHLGVPIFRWHGIHYELGIYNSNKYANHFQTYQNKNFNDFVLRTPFCGAPALPIRIDECMMSLPWAKFVTG